MLTTQLIEIFGEPPSPALFKRFPGSYTMSVTSGPDRHLTRTVAPELPVLHQRHYLTPRPAPARHENHLPVSDRLHFDFHLPWIEKRSGRKDKISLARGVVRLILEHHPSR